MLEYITNHCTNVFKPILSPMRDYGSSSIQDSSVWKSYRRAALRCNRTLTRTSNDNDSSSVSPSHPFGNKVCFSVDELDDIKLMESDSGKNNLRTEINRLRRLVEKKDLLIDLLMERIVKLQRVDISAKDEEGSNGNSGKVSRLLEVLNTDTGCSPSLNNTFIVQCSTGTNEMNAQSNIRDSRNVGKGVENELDQGYSSNPIRLSSNVFIIESFSSSSEDNHPDWKAPLPPSIYLRKNRPELIRRIENRQAAIRAAATLRHRVAEEKMKAARDVVERKCTVHSVRKSLMLDPTRITAFPRSEMVNLSKRRLRASCAYKTEVLGGRSRIDIAASKVIAHTFSEVTRQAILARR